MLIAFLNLFFIVLVSAIGTHVPFLLNLSLTSLISFLIYQFDPNISQVKHNSDDQYRTTEG